MSRLGEQLEAEAIARQTAEAELRAAAEAAECADCGRKKSPPPSPELPHFEWRRPWLERFWGKGCLTCGSAGWLQKVISTPANGRWFPRSCAFVLWLSTIPPRIVSRWRTLHSADVNEAQYTERMAICRAHNVNVGNVAACSVRFLHRRSGTSYIFDELHCKKCNCPRTPTASLAVKNWKAGWQCPNGLHPGSNPNEPYQKYVQLAIEAAAVAAAEAADKLDTEDAPENP